MSAPKKSSQGRRIEKPSNDPFFNRELSWLEFNARVLDLAFRDDWPLLERIKFISIFASNLDEFFMVRVAALKRQIESGRSGNCPSGMSPREEREAIGERVDHLVERQLRHLREHLLPALERAGLRLVESARYSAAQALRAAEIFRNDLLPLLTPVRLEPGRPFPLAGNGRLHVAFRIALKAGGTDERYAVVQLPPELKRFLPLPEPGDRQAVTCLEEVVIHSAGELFPGYSVLGVAVVRILRDADLGVNERRDEDFRDAMEEMLLDRDKSPPVRIEAVCQDDRLRERLQELLAPADGDWRDVEGPVGCADLMELAARPGMENFRLPPWTPRRPAGLPAGEDLWSAVRQRDLLLHHPYESFDVLSAWLGRAGEDGEVLSIRVVLYRTSRNSAVVSALAHAARNGVHVTALVELKARFDEERNLDWAERLEKAGVLVIYGIADLKVHAKIMLVVRREPEGIVRYLHLGTGNYNESTARQYQDIGFMTCREPYITEAVQVLNAVTGYSHVPPLSSLAIAPTGLKSRLLGLVEREMDMARSKRPARIAAKINSLADPDVIRALYRASRAGVEIALNVRGICMLVPGVKGHSENIRVVSIVGRFLEHSRVFYFHNNGDFEVYLSSADWMPRNLEKRVELMFPILQPDLKGRVKGILERYFKDTRNAYLLQPGGAYRRVLPPAGQAPFDVMEDFCREARENGGGESKRHRTAFAVRRGRGNKPGA